MASLKFFGTSVFCCSFFVPFPTIVMQNLPRYSLELPCSPTFFLHLDATTELNPFCGFIMAQLSLKMTGPTVDGRNPAPVEVGSLSTYLQGFIHPRWCRISSINRTNTVFNLSCGPKLPQLNLGPQRTRYPGPTVRGVPLVISPQQTLLNHHPSCFNRVKPRNLHRIQHLGALTSLGYSKIHH